MMRPLSSARPACATCPGTIRRSISSTALASASTRRTRVAQKGSAAWQPQLCRAFLKVEGGSAVGYVSDLTIRDRVTLDDLAARVASAALWRP